MSGVAARTEKAGSWSRLSVEESPRVPASGTPAPVNPQKTKWGRAITLLGALLAETALLAVLFLAYEMGRHFADGRVEQAVDNAVWLWDLERALHLPSEQVIQAWALGWEPLARLANLYYILGHFPVVCALLVGVFVWAPQAYGRLRAELVIATAMGLVLHILAPMAPPRLMPQFDMVDTMSLVGPSAYPPPGSGIANQYAAMPSLHVGWALVVAIVVIRVLKGRWRWLALAHPVATTAVVVVTANHYWLDAIVGSALVGIAVLAASVLSTTLPPRLTRIVFGPPWRSSRLTDTAGNQPATEEASAESGDDFPSGDAAPAGEGDEWSPSYTDPSARRPIAASTPSS